jgi:hypothetical protein
MGWWRDTVVGALATWGALDSLFALLRNPYQLLTSLVITTAIFAAVWVSWASMNG